MVKGRAGLQLEAWKFSIYIGIPIVASMVFNSPTIQAYAADYFQFLKYPANPNTNLKEEFESFRQEFEKTQKQREEYRAQIQKLADRVEGNQDETVKTVVVSDTKKRGWLGLW
jgi:FtsZ-binding cell division protein ZapB